MKYTMTEPCDECPFLNKFKKGFTTAKLKGFASGNFPCHKTAEIKESDSGVSEFQAGNKSVHCAGALIFNEKRNTPHHMMRIAERLGMYDYTKLNMEADVR